MPDSFQAGPAASVDLPDDLSREVYCILGMPVDAIGMCATLRRIQSAATSGLPYLVSTPNLNFLVTSQVDLEFRESLILSDLCTADGIAVIWIAWLLGIPITNRIAGSDIFDALKATHSSEHPLKIFIFGGPEGAAVAASRALNNQPSGLHCVGSFYPGFCSVDEMSRDEIIGNINCSGANLLMASLGARKGQLWLLRNYHRLRIPVRVHLGATVNFQAGTVRRAPPSVRGVGLEWLWRIKEEPHLWRRYWNDWKVLIHLLFVRVLPLIFWTRWLQLKYERREADLTVKQTYGDKSVILTLSGSATSRNVEIAVRALSNAIATKKQITVDFSDSRVIDLRFLGLLLMLKKKLKNTCANPTFVGLSPGLRRIFRLNNIEFASSFAK